MKVNRVLSKFVTMRMICLSSTDSSLLESIKQRTQMNFVSNKLSGTQQIPSTKMCSTFSTFQVEIFFPLFSPSWWMSNENIILYKISSSVQIIEQPEFSLLKKKFYYFFYLFSIISTRFSLLRFLLLQIRNILKYCAKSL